MQSRAEQSRAGKPKRDRNHRDEWKDRRGRARRSRGGVSSCGAALNPEGHLSQHGLHLLEHLGHQLAGSLLGVFQSMNQGVRVVPPQRAVGVAGAPAMREGERTLQLVWTPCIQATATETTANVPCTSQPQPSHPTDPSNVQPRCITSPEHLVNLHQPRLPIHEQRQGERGAMVAHQHVGLSHPPYLLLNAQTPKINGQDLQGEGGCVSLCVCNV